MLCKPRPQSIGARDWPCQRGKIDTRCSLTFHRRGCRCPRGTARRSGSGPLHPPWGRSRREGKLSTLRSATWTSTSQVGRACMRSHQTSGCTSPGGRASTHLDQRGPGSQRTRPESRGCRRCPWPLGACPRGSACTGLRRGSARCPPCKWRTRQRHRAGCAHCTRSKRQRLRRGVKTETGSGHIRCRRGCVRSQGRSTLSRAALGWNCDLSQAARRGRRRRPRPPPRWSTCVHCRRAARCSSGRCRRPR